MRKTGLEVKRDRVVDPATHPLLGEMCHQRITPLRPDRVEAVDVEPIGQRRRRRDLSDMGQLAVVPGGAGAAQLGPARQVAQFHPEHGRLNRVQSRVDADLVVDVAPTCVVLPVHTEATQSLRQSIVAGRDEAAVPPRAQVLGRIERETAERAQRSR